jgi:hypothetical protein
VAAGTVVDAHSAGGGIIQAATSYGPYTTDMPGLTNPIGIHWAGLDVLGRASQAGYAAAVLLAIASLAARRRGADPVTRQQLKWVSAAGVLLAVELLLEVIPGHGPLGFTTWTGPLTVVLFLGSIVIAVLRYRLWDLDLLIRWSVVYGTLTLVVALAYLAVVVATGAITNRQVSLGPSLLAASLAVAVVALLRDRVHHWVERALYGDRQDPYRALTTLGERLDAPGSSDDVLTEVVDAIAQSLRLSYVAVIVPIEGLVADIGTPVPTFTGSRWCFEPTRWVSWPSVREPVLASAHRNGGCWPTWPVRWPPCFRRWRPDGRSNRRAWT